MANEVDAELRARLLVSNGTSPLPAVETEEA